MSDRIAQTSGNAQHRRLVVFRQRAYRQGLFAQGMQQDRTTMSLGRTNVQTRLLMGSQRFGTQGHKMDNRIFCKYSDGLISPSHVPLDNLREHEHGLVFWGEGDGSHRNGGYGLTDYPQGFRLPFIIEWDK